MEPGKISAREILEKTAEITKNELTQKNVYNEDSFEYNSTNPNALSDGDNKGRGLNNDSIGTLIDNTEYKRLTGINMFNKDNEYK